MKMDDANATAKSIVGDTSQLGVSKDLNVNFIKDIETKVRGVLEGGGEKIQEKIKGKKEEIEAAL